MIQRSQTLYLILSVALLAILFLSPICVVLDHSSVFQIYVSKPNPAVLGAVQHTLPLILSIILAGLTSLVSIFLFKNRKLQILIVQIAVMFSLICIILIGSYLYIYMHIGTEIHARPTLWVSTPFIALILDFLAIKGIRKDQALVDSLNRIR